MIMKMAYLYLPCYYGSEYVLYDCNKGINATSHFGRIQTETVHDEDRKVPIDRMMEHE